MERGDKYKNFQELQAVESLAAYRIVCLPRGSSLLVLAPHGGSIEGGTSELARAVAGSDLSLYLFEGRKLDNNRDLHITSSNFDEPSGLAIASSSNTVVTVHGEKNEQEASCTLEGWT